MPLRSATSGIVVLALVLAATMAASKRKEQETPHATVPPKPQNNLNVIPALGLRG